MDSTYIFTTCSSLTTSGIYENNNNNEYTLFDTYLTVEIKSSDTEARIGQCIVNDDATGGHTCLNNYASYINLDLYENEEVEVRIGGYSSGNFGRVKLTIIDLNAPTPTRAPTTTRAPLNMDDITEFTINTTLYREYEDGNDYFKISKQVLSTIISDINYTTLQSDWKLIFNTFTELTMPTVKYDSTYFIFTINPNVGLTNGAPSVDANLKFIKKTI
jgi:hypothetical protein